MEDVTDPVAMPSPVVSGRMTANVALSTMRSKLTAKAIPPGILTAIIEALLSVFKNFCPQKPPATSELRTVAQSGLEAYNTDNVTAERMRLRRALRRQLGFFSRHLDSSERAVWEIAAEATDEETHQYALVWQQERLPDEE